MNSISNFLRSILVLFLALAGIAMAFILMVSTAIALGVMYIVARVRGKPFAPAAFWQARRNGMQWQFVRPGQTSADAGASHARDTEAPSPARQPRRVRRDLNVTDVEARDIS